MPLPYPYGSICFDCRYTDVSAVTLYTTSWDEPSSFISCFSLKGSEFWAPALLQDWWQSVEILPASPELVLAVLP